MNILDLLGDLNWPAVAVAAVAYFALGGLWYIPGVFGDRWTRSIGWDPSGEEKPGPAMYLGPLITCFLATLTIAVLAGAIGVDGVGDGLVLGLVVGIGISGTVLLVTGFFDPVKPKPMTWFGITAGYHLVGMLIAAVILSVWT